LGDLTTERREVHRVQIYTVFPLRALLVCNNTSPLDIKQKATVLLKFMATEWLKTQRRNSVKE